MDAFYHGLMRPFLDLADLLLLVAAGLYLGQQSRGHLLKRSMWLFGALFVFLFLAYAADLTGPAWVSYLMTLLLGLLIAGNVALPGIPGTLLIIACGGMLGGSFETPDASQAVSVVGILGSLAGIAVLLYYPMLLAEWMQKREWQRIAVRILGSWMAASTLLTLAFIVQTSPTP
ncbi:MAG: HupE/UreJ family protein [Candidatus Thiodiazotropha sp.]